MLVYETKPNEFYCVGSGLTVAIYRDPDADDQLAGIAAVEQVTKRDDKWIVERELNGDQTNQGRELQMSAQEVHVYRLKLYSYSKAGVQ